MQIAKALLCWLWHKPPPQTKSIRTSLSTLLSTVLLHEVFAQRQTLHHPYKPFETNPSEAAHKNERGTQKLSHGAPPLIFHASALFALHAGRRTARAPVVSNALTTHCMALAIVGARAFFVVALPVRAFGLRLLHYTSPQQPEFQKPSKISPTESRLLSQKPV
jgi:hypothetical protein